MIKLFDRDKEFFKDTKFPCIGCVIYPGCTKICVEVEWNTKKLTRHFNEHYLAEYLKRAGRRGRFICPDCGGPARRTANVIHHVQCRQCNHSFILKYVVNEMIGILQSVNRWMV